MKFFPSQFSLLSQGKGARRNFGYFFRVILILTVFVAVFSVLFHYIMEYEGRDYSWITGLYWTLTVMSTLGFGDITFNSDLGRAFSIVVLLTGIVGLLIVLPSSFIQFVYTPWLEAQKKKEVQHSLPASARNHVIIVGVSPVARNLAQVLARYGFHSVLLCSTTQQALDLMDLGLHAVVGDYDDVQVYRGLHAQNARLVVALDTDVRNINVAFTLRELDKNVPMVSRAERDESIDILKLAGCSSVFQFRKSLGRSLTRRVITDKLSVSPLVTFGPLVIAEAPVKQTSLSGMTLKESDLRGRTGINVVGLWNHGVFEHPGPDTVLEEHKVLVMAGSREQMQAFSRELARKTETEKPAGRAPVLVIGGGRVGTAALALKERGLDVVVVDRSNIASRIPGIRVQVGDASDPFTLEQAGIKTSPSILITTHDDDTNIYLTIYCRRLRPDIQIISSPAASASASALPAAWLSSRSSSSATRQFPRWTCPFRARSSTCWSRAGCSCSTKG